MLLHSLHRYCLTPISPSYKSASILLSHCTRFTSILAGSDSDRLRFVPEHTAVCSHQLKQLRDQLNLLTSTSAQDKRDGLLVITGAGISTESGIPDYRSAGVGLYSRSGQRPVQYADFIASDKVRRRYWARSCVGWRRLRRIQPNSTHSVLAKAERCGRVHTIVTQNVDRLHHKAGSRNVVELHGSLYDVVCTGCDYCVSRDDFQEMMLRLNANHFRPEESEMRPDGDVDLDETVRIERIDTMPDRFLLSLVRHGQSEGNRLRLLQGSSDAHPLSELGHKQASALGQQLASSRVANPSTVYCSPLTRARQTCRHLVAAFGTTSSKIDRLAAGGQSTGPVVNSSSDNIDTSLNQDESFTIEPLLSEKCFGEMEDLPIDRYLEVLRASKSSSSEYVPAGGESCTQVQERAAKFFQLLCQRHLVGNGETSTASRETADSLTTSGESSDDSLSHVLVVSHGCLLRGLLSHLLVTYGECGGLDRGVVGRITPNTGLSQLVISRNTDCGADGGSNSNNSRSSSGSRDGIRCRMLTVHDITHLADLEAPQIPNL